MRCLFLPLAALTVFLLPAPAVDPELNLIVIEGEGATNNIRLRTAREPVVRAEDQNHKPVAGATVVFTLPAQGAGGSFANGAQTLITHTDSAGRAIARGFHPNKIQGQFQIHVNASFGVQTAAVPSFRSLSLRTPMRHLRRYPQSSSAAWLGTSPEPSGR
jgi:hypothetical protein